MRVGALVASVFSFLGFLLGVEMQKIMLFSIFVLCKHLSEIFSSEIVARIW